MTAEKQARSELHRLRRVRLEMLERHPFWGHLLMHVRFVPAPDLPTFAATDCDRAIWFNPRLTAPLDLRQLGFVVAHELGHHLLASGPRRRERDPELWNQATDYAINRVVERIADEERGEATYRSPAGPHPELGDVEILRDPRFDGLVAEGIYERLQPPDEAAKRIRVVLPDPDGGRPIVAEGVVQHDGGIDVHVAHGPLELTEAQREALADRVEQAVSRWTESERRGDAAGSLLRALGPPRRGRLPWQRLLHRFAREALQRDDYALSPPHRRWLADGLVVPARIPSNPTDIVVSVDTSGSMTPPMIDAVAAELRSLGALVPTLTVLVCDARLHRVVEPHELPAFLRSPELRGGGGTSHLPVFHWLEERRRRPDLLVGLTDLHTRLPSARPPFPVVWICPPRHGRAPWGHVVPLTSSEIRVPELRSTNRPKPGAGPRARS